MPTILLVEDNENIGSNLSYHLGREGFEVIWVVSLEEAHKALLHPVDLIILDWMLPDGQGIHWISKVRNSVDFIPVIMLTARSDLIDKVVGLELGADDYITKPCDPRELVARIRVQLRNLQNHVSRLKQDKDQKADLVVELGPVHLNVSRREVFLNGDLVSLAKMEFDLLQYFMENPHKVISRDEILEHVWGVKYLSSRTVDTHVLRLRKKIHGDYFQTVHGSGYRFKPPSP